MNNKNIDDYSYSELKNIALYLKIPVRRKRSDLLNDIKNTYKSKDKYIIIKQLGNKGKEGITYLVCTPNKKKCAMKTFSKKKSKSSLLKESKLQMMASMLGIAPKIIDVNVESKYIVMEKMDNHLINKINKQNGILTENQQKEIINIYKKLDKSKVFHGDANLLNYMYKKKKLYMIDFGMSQKITPQLIKKLGTSTPNLDIMTLGLVLKLKSGNCPKESYEILLKYLSHETLIKFNLL